MVCVLVADGHAVRAESMVRGLRRQGFEANSVDAGAGALNMHSNADLVLLDLGLPDIDGLAVCRAIRAASGTPIIAVADRDDELERVLALQAGADDCVVRSCGIREVIARIEAVVRRTHPQPLGPGTISLCKLHIDRAVREVRLADRVIEVTAKEFELLYTLAANPDTVVSRKELMSKVWDSDWAESSRTIDTHVSSLRGKLGANTWITTVRGVGYQIGRGAEEPDCARRNGVPHPRWFGIDLERTFRPIAPTSGRSVPEPRTPQRQTADSQH